MKILRRKGLLQIGLIMSAKSKKYEIRNIAKSVKNKPNKNEEKNFLENCET